MVRRSFKQKNVNQPRTDVLVGCPRRARRQQRMDQKGKRFVRHLQIAEWQNVAVGLGNNGEAFLPGATAKSNLVRHLRARIFTENWPAKLQLEVRSLF